jgi:hypothetical protein
VVSRALVWLLVAGCDPVSWLRPPPDDPPDRPRPTNIDPCANDLTWENFAGPWASTWCTPCHSSHLEPELRQGAPLGVDFDTYALAHPHLDGWLAWAVPDDASMPPAGGPLAAERRLVEEWVNCGAPGVVEPVVETCVNPIWVGPTALGSQEEVDALCDGSWLQIDGDLQVGTDAPIPCVCTITGDLTTNGDAAALDLPELSSIAGALRVEQDGGLTRIEAPALVEVGELVLADSAELADVQLGALHTVLGALSVTRLPALHTLEVSQLAHVDGSVVFEDNPILVNLAPRRLTWVGGGLRWALQPSLPTADVLDSLRFVGGELHISGQERPFELQGIRALEAVGGELEIVENPGLTRIDGLTGLRAVQGDLSVGYNRALTEIAGFTNLIEVGADLEIVATAVEELDGFGALQRTGGLTIRSNHLLTALTGFALLEEIDGDLVVRNNASLPLDEAEAFAAGLTVTGTVDLGD